MWLFTFFLIFAVIALSLLLWSRFIKVKTAQPDESHEQSEFDDRSRSTHEHQIVEINRSARIRRHWVLVAAAIAGGLCLLCLIFGSLVMVSTKNVGIKTNFGATDGRFSNGLHVKPPWVKVTEMDAAVQTDSYTKDPTVGTPGDNPCIPVRIANQQTSCVHVSIRWRICTKKVNQGYVDENGKQHQIVCHPDAADELFQNYRVFDHVRDSLVTRELTAALNEQFSDYNPLNSVLGGVLPKGQRPNPPLAKYAARVTSQMRSEIGNQIEVLSTIIPIATFDKDTQSRINQLQQQVALTRIAQQAQQTATAQATANNNLAKSVSHAPNVLVAQCLDILTQIVKNRQTVPPGFSCWPGSGVAAVIAGSSTK